MSSTESINKTTESTETKIQYILDENGELAEIPKDQCKPVEYPIKYKVKNAFEVFVRVDGTENYWISNYGRCVNNLNHKDKNTFYEHKQGKCHYTVFEIKKQIVSYPAVKSKNGTRKPNKKKERIERVFCANVPEEECIPILEEMQKNNTRRIYSMLKVRNKRETSPEELVAEVFLVILKNHKVYQISCC